MKRYEHWLPQPYDEALAETLAAKLNISPVVTGILLNRGLQTETEMRDFLYGKAEPYYDPFLMKDLKKPAERIWQAVDKK